MYSITNRYSPKLSQPKKKTVYKQFKCKEKQQILTQVSDWSLFVRERHAKNSFPWAGGFWDILWHDTWWNVDCERLSRGGRWWRQYSRHGQRTNICTEACWHQHLFETDIIKPLYSQGSLICTSAQPYLTWLSTPGLDIVILTLQQGSYTLLLDSC